MPLELHQNSQKHLIKCKRLVTNINLFLHKIVIRWSENSMGFEKSYLNWFPMGQILCDFISVLKDGMYE